MKIAKKLDGHDSIRVGLLKLGYQQSRLHSLSLFLANNGNGATPNNGSTGEVRVHLAHLHTAPPVRHPRSHSPERGIDERRHIQLSRRPLDDNVIGLPSWFNLPPSDSDTQTARNLQGATCTPYYSSQETIREIAMKKKNKLGIVIGLAIIIAVVVLLAFSPVFKTGTLKIKYISDEANTGNHNDGINQSGNILIYIDESLKGIFPADQYVTFNWFTIGKHTIDIYKDPPGFQNPGRLLASKDTIVNVLETATVDIHYWDGLF